MCAYSTYKMFCIKNIQTNKQTKNRTHITEQHSHLHLKCATNLRFDFVAAENAKAYSPIFEFIGCLRPFAALLISRVSLLCYLLLLLGDRALKVKTYICEIREWERRKKNALFRPSVNEWRYNLTLTLSNVIGCTLHRSRQMEIFYFAQHK